MLLNFLKKLQPKFLIDHLKIFLINTSDGLKSQYF